MSLTINFDTLKFNLYEILNISTEASEHKIKKAFRNLILNFHPDKNNKNEEDIYYHIVTANQILTNKVNRKKYDDYLNKLQDTHDELKTNFNNKKYEPVELKEEAYTKFKNKFNELEKKHLYNYDTNLILNYDKLLQARNKEINIPNENIKNYKEFNIKFEEKINNGIFNDQLIQVNEDMRLSTYNVNDNYTSLDIAFDNLYIDGGGISTSKYSSLDSAFKLQPVNTKIKDINIKQAMDSYKNITNNLSNIQYSKDKFEIW